MTPECMVAMSIHWVQNSSSGGWSTFKYHCTTD